MYCNPRDYSLPFRDKTTTLVCMEPQTISQKGRECQRDWRMDPTDAN